jgi:large subunit ribosomal protein L24
MKSKVVEKVKMHVKTGDTVKVIAGNDKGKTGRIMAVKTDKNKVIVEGLNMVTKHNKPNAKNPNGSITKQEAAIHVSNVMLVDPASGNAVRTGKKENSEGKLQRYSKKSGELI